MPYIYHPSSNPRVPGGQHHTLLPGVRGSRASSDRTSLIIPRLGAYLASVLNYLDQMYTSLLFVTTVGPSVLGRRRAGFGSIYQDTCSRYDQSMPRSWTLNRAELQRCRRSCRCCCSSNTCSIADDPSHALSSPPMAALHVFRYPVGGAYRLSSEGKQAVPSAVSADQTCDHSIVKRRQCGIPLNTTLARSQGPPFR